MPDPEAKKPQIPENPKIAEKIAAAEEATKHPTSPTFLDLAKASQWSKNVAEPQFTIRYGSTMGFGSVRAVETIIQAATEGRVTNPQPAALIIHQDETNPRILYGIPTMKKSRSYLNLTWLNDNEVKASFKAILQLKEIVIPPGSRMVIDVEKIVHSTHGHCVKFSWDEDCFLPINERWAGNDNET